MVTTPKQKKNLSVGIKHIGKVDKCEKHVKIKINSRVIPRTAKNNSIVFDYDLIGCSISPPGDQPRM